MSSIARTCYSTAYTLGRRIATQARLLSTRSSSIDSAVTPRPPTSGIEIVVASLSSALQLPNNYQNSEVVMKLTGVYLSCINNMAMEDVQAYPLHEAIECGHVPCVSKLLIGGVPVNQIDSLGRTPLHVAAATGNSHIADLLLGFGAKVDSKDSTGATPMDCAARKGHLAACQVLLKARNEIDLSYR